MISAFASAVTVQTTNQRGFTPEEVAERCVNKIVSISDSVTPELRAQAEAYRKELLALVTFYMKEAINSDRTTIINALNKAGQPELAKHIRSL